LNPECALQTTSFVTALIGDRAVALHARLTHELAWTPDVADEFLTRAGLGLLGHLRNNEALDLASLGEHDQMFDLVSSLDLQSLVADLQVEVSDAWRAAWWTGIAVTLAVRDRLAANGWSSPAAMASGPSLN